MTFALNTLAGYIYSYILNTEDRYQMFLQYYVGRPGSQPSFVTTGTCLSSVHKYFYGLFWYIRSASSVQSPTCCVGIL